MGIGKLAFAVVLFSAMFFVWCEAIDCFTRSGSISSNGTTVACAGYSYCYSYFSYGTANYAGCSLYPPCSSFSCVVCSTDYCNSVTPSAISCYTRSGSIGNNGTMTSCQTGISSCYSFSSGSSSYAGCGTCTSSSYPSCVNCNTDYCNTATPSAISCYYRSGSISTYNNPGTITTCNTGISSCFSYTTGYNAYGDCGTCSTENEGSCVICRTDNCNTHLPSSISCYYRSGSYVSATSSYNGTVIPCSTGVSTCYYYLVPQYYGSYYYSYAGCGVCSSNATSAYACRTCSTNNCNYLTSNATATGAANTHPSFAVTSLPATSHSTVPNVSPNLESTSASAGIASSISASTTAPLEATSIICYYMFAETLRSSKRQVTCSGSSCFSYDFSFGSMNFFFAGCGNCSFSSYTNCRTCFTDICNTGSVSASSLKVSAASAAAAVMILMKLV